jgi:EmrB/QacA subfamily drug resistance transporter
MSSMENQKQDKLYKWLALLVVVLGTFMAILDTSIVNVAIPKMMNVFGVSTDEIQWVLTAYMLTMGTVIPLTGYLGDNYGTKKTYIWALIAFTIGSALCGFAWSNSSMIFARVIQALGGGMIMPISMAIIYQVIPQEERGMALGIWGIAAMAAPAIGPTLSGYIVENMDWRFIFTINIPVGIIAVVLAALLLRDTPRKPSKSFDIIGFITSTLGLVSILYVLGEGSSIDWNDFKNIFLIIVGCFLLLIFVINELTHEDPLLDLRVFKILPFTLSLTIASILNIALFGGIFVIPLFLQNLQGYTALQTGMIMFPSALATGIMMPIGGKLFDKFGPKLVVIPGLIFLALSTYELSQMTLETSTSTITWLLVLRGFGLGLAMMPAMTSGMNRVPMQLVARASALNNVVRQIASSIGVAVLTTIMTHQQAINYARMGEQITSVDANSWQLQKLLQGVFTMGGLSTGEVQGMATGTLYGLVQKQAMVGAIGHTLMVTTLVVVVTIPLAFLLKGTKKLDASVKTSKETPGDAQAHVMME